MNTLGLFARQPVPGRVKTRLAADWGAEQATRLYECFVRDLLDRFAGAGDRRVAAFAPGSEEARGWFAEAASAWQLWPQPDGDLGTRMTLFFESWCTQDGDCTLLIGSDSPTLPEGSLEQAWEILASHDCVLGPAEDGGYWLIGLRGPFGASHRVLFEGIDWSTPRVLEQTLDRARGAGMSRELLPLWYDIDTAADVDRLRSELATDSCEPGPAVPRIRTFFRDRDEN